MPSLAEAISCLQKASSCRGCGRLPSSSDDRAHNGDGGFPRCSDSFYGGALFLSSKCGDLFCAACWEKSMPNCPICHCETESTPKPMIATLAADSKANAFEHIALSDISQRRCNLGELSSLVSILRNLTSTAPQTSGAIDKVDINIGHVDSFEEKVQGTFQELYQYQIQKTPRSGIKSIEAETPTVLESQFSALRTAINMHEKQHTPHTGMKSDKSETPTVRESQVTSGTNSISLLKSVDRSEAYEETQTIPGTYLTPLHTNSARKVDQIRRSNNAQLNYFIDNTGKVDSPTSSTAPKPKRDLSSSSDESEVEGTCLSPFKMNCRKKIETQDDEDSTSEEEFQTEPWERQLPTDFAKVDNRVNKPEPVVKRRCVSTSPNEAITELSLQLKSDAAKTPRREGMQSMTSPKKQLYIAYDVLNDNECEALSSLCNRKGVRIMSDIVSVSRGGVVCALPTILITHAIEKPRFSNGEPTRYNSIATCHRTFSYMKAVALGARCVDAQWLRDCQTSGTLLCCDSYSIWCDLETHNSLIASGSKIEGTTIRGSPPFNNRSPLKLDGVVFGFLDTETDNALTSVQISSLVKCWGGSVSNDSFTLMHVLIARDCATLNQVVHKLRACLQDNRDVTTESWSIELFNDEELEALINNDGTLNNSYGEDYRVPIIRAKWLENSICGNSLQSLKEYCIGVLCFEFDMGSDVGERQTLLC